MQFVQVEHPQAGAATVPASAVKHMEPKGWTVVGEATGPDGGLLFDPTGHTVEDVNEYLSTAPIEERERVLDAERNGKSRVGIVGA